ncbi:3'-5' exonuclease [Verrucomicrobiaceae bacterium N1E253]|uniref:3'-5' exonuclease n=1 Tax=Oceaniferula marina TaxID=2748318 RepID=A0A851GHS1_9BACT|nr:exonuclease domain-containing protein [Oceaniferula marina]NWK54677.1 3'-5' exonuclease [Oceaniferula marina]
MIRQHTFAAIDFESAGAARGKTDVPVQIGMAMWTTDSGHHRPFVSFIRADRPITWAAQKVHGIGSADLADAPAFMTLWPEIKSTLGGNVVVAHGHGTEKRYLRAFPAHGFEPWVDTLLLARAAWPDLPSHALGDLCNHFQLSSKVSELTPGKTWHDALYDATASLVLLEYLIDTLKLSNSPLDVLIHPDTSDWHRIRRT